MIIECISGVVIAPFSLEESCEVENPDYLDQDHDCHADTDESFHVAPLATVESVQDLLAEVGVKRFAADTELTRKGRFLLTGCGPTT